MENFKKLNISKNLEKKKKVNIIFLIINTTDVCKIFIILENDQG